MSTQSSQPKLQTKSFYGRVRRCRSADNVTTFEVWNSQGKHIISLPGVHVIAKNRLVQITSQKGVVVRVQAFKENKTPGPVLFER